MMEEELKAYKRAIDVALTRYHQLHQIHRTAKSNEEISQLVRECVSDWNNVPEGNPYLEALKKEQEGAKALWNLAESAWILLAKLDWNKQPDSWHKAAVAWRERWHNELSNNPSGKHV